jgi:hypothetical protein
MDNLFLIRVLTTAINEMMTPGMKVYNRIFRGKEHLEPSDRLAFDIISGSEKVLKSISIYAPAEVTDKTARRTITLTAPRLAQKRFIHTAELNALRAYGEQVQTEMMETRIAREQKDMRGIMDRTLEFWAVNALKGVIYDADMTTQLVDYGMDSDHLVTLTGTDLWSDADDSDPVGNLRTWKRLIELEAMTGITGWVAFHAGNVGDALLNHDNVRELLRYSRGASMAENGRIERLAEVELIENNDSFVDLKGNRQYFIPAGYLLLVGLCDDLVDVPYAPIVDDDAPGGVGNIGAEGNGVLYFSKSWKVQDPSGRWIKAETRPLPVLQRPGAVIYAKVV